MATRLAHAEILAIRQAARGNGWLAAGRLQSLCDPRALCHVRWRAGQQPHRATGVSRPVTRKAGYCGSLGNLVQDARLNHRLEIVEGVLAEESGALLRAILC